MDEDEVFDHVKNITGTGNNFEQAVSVLGGNEKTTYYFSMSQSCEKAHWQTFDVY